MTMKDHPLLNISIESKAKTSLLKDVVDDVDSNAPAVIAIQDSEDSDDSTTASESSNGSSKDDGAASGASKGKERIDDRMNNEPSSEQDEEEHEFGIGSIAPNRRESLQDVLLSARDGMTSQAPSEFLETYMKIMNEYKSSNMFKFTLREGDILPDFSLLDETGNFTSSVDLLSNHDYLVVNFFRGGWCHFCETTLKVWNEYIPQFQQRNTAFVSISPQLVEYNASLKEEYGLKFPLLADKDCEYAETCMVAYEMDERIRCPNAQKMPTYNGNNDYILPMPSTFVVSASDQRIAYCYYEVDPWKRAEPTDVLAAIASSKTSAVSAASTESESTQTTTAEPQKEVEVDQITDTTIPFETTMTLKDALKAEIQRLEDLRDLPSVSLDTVGSRRKSIRRELYALKEAGIASTALKEGRNMPSFRLQACSIVLSTFENNDDTSTDNDSTTDNADNMRNSKKGCIIKGQNSKPKVYDSKKLLASKKKGDGGALVVVFIHGDWNSFCQLTIKAWQDQYTKLQAKGGKLIVICPSETFKVSSSDDKFDFPILWDVNNTLAKKFRLRYQMDAVLPGQPSDVSWPLPMTATYVVDNTTQEIRYCHVDCDHTKRAEPSEVIEQHVPTGLVTTNPPKKRGAFSLRLRGWLPIKTAKAMKNHLDRQ